MGLQTKQEILVYMRKGFWSRDLALLDHIPRIGLVEWDRASSAHSVLLMETLLRGGEEGNRILILGSLLL